VSATILHVLAPSRPARPCGPTFSPFSVADPPASIADRPLLEWERIATHVHVLLKAHHLLAPWIAAGGSVWVDSDETSLSVLLVRQDHPLVEVQKTGPGWWRPATMEHGTIIAQQMAMEIKSRLGKPAR
jgi:hypothetical protein